HAPLAVLLVRVRGQLVRGAVRVGVEGARGQVVEELVDDDDVEAARATADEPAGLRVDEVEVDLRYAQPRQRADERAAGRARGNTLKVAALFLTQHEGLERAARQLDGEVVDPLERDLAVDRQRRQELEQARR